MKDGTTNMQYSTTDLPTAVFLALQGHSWTLEPSRHREVASFKFTRTSGLEEHVQALAIGDALVSPTAYETVRKRVVRDDQRQVLFALSDN